MSTKRKSIWSLSHAESQFKTCRRHSGLRSNTKKNREIPEPERFTATANRCKGERFFALSHTDGHSKEWIAPQKSIHMNITHLHGSTQISTLKVGLKQKCHSINVVRCSLPRPQSFHVFRVLMHVRGGYIVRPSLYSLENLLEPLLLVTRRILRMCKCITHTSAAAIFSILGRCRVLKSCQLAKIFRVMRTLPSFTYADAYQDHANDMVLALAPFCGLWWQAPT